MASGKQQQLLDPRDGEDGFRRRFPPGDYFLCPLFWVSICIKAVDISEKDERCLAVGELFPSDQTEAPEVGITKHPAYRSFATIPY